MAMALGMGTLICVGLPTPPARAQTTPILAFSVTDPIKPTLAMPVVAVRVTNTGSTDLTAEAILEPPHDRIGLDRDCPISAPPLTTTTAVTTTTTIKPGGVAPDPPKSPPASVLVSGPGLRLPIPTRTTVCIAVRLMAAPTAAISTRLIVVAGGATPISRSIEVTAPAIPSEPALPDTITASGRVGKHKRIAKIIPGLAPSKIAVGYLDGPGEEVWPVMVGDLEGQTALIVKGIHRAGTYTGSIDVTPGVDGGVIKMTVTAHRSAGLAIGVLFLGYAVASIMYVMATSLQTVLAAREAGAALLGRALSARKLLDEEVDLTYGPNSPLADAAHARYSVKEEPTGDEAFEVDMLLGRLRQASPFGAGPAADTADKARAAVSSYVDATTYAVSLLRARRTLVDLLNEVTPGAGVIAFIDTTLKQPRTESQTAAALSTATATADTTVAQWRSWFEHLAELDAYVVEHYDSKKVAELHEIIATEREKMLLNVKYKGDEEIPLLDGRILLPGTTKPQRDMKSFAFREIWNQSEIRWVQRPESRRAAGHAGQHRPASTAHGASSRDYERVRRS